LRLFATAAVAAIGVHNLLSHEFAKEVPPAQVARGKRGVQIMSFALSSANGQIATTDSAGRLALRPPENGWRTERILNFPGFASEVAFAPDGRSLAVRLHRVPDIYLQKLDSPASEPIRAKMGSIQRIGHAVFSPDGRFLAVTSDEDGTIVIWDVAAQKERIVLHQPSPVARLAFSPGGRRLATAGKCDQSIQLWDLLTGSRRILMENAPGTIAALAFSPDGAFLASASFADHDVRLWELKKPEVRRVLSGHARSVNSVAFSPDGSLLATAGNDGSLGLWSVATGERLLSLDSQATCLRSVAFSPDGRTLILATEDDDDIRSWHLPELLPAARKDPEQLL
jgi:WD40 repeat protein